MIRELALILTAHDYGRLVRAFDESGLDFQPDTVKTFKHDAWDLVSLKWDAIFMNSDEYRLIKKFLQPLDNFDFLEIDPMATEVKGTFGLLEPTISLP